MVDDASRKKASISAAVIFAVLMSLFLFLCIFHAIVKFFREKKRKAGEKPQDEMHEYWSNHVPADRLPIPHPVAQPNGIQRDARGNKILPRIYRNREGVFERPTLNQEGFYEAPRSFVENDMPAQEADHAKREAQNSRAIQARLAAVSPLPTQLSGRQSDSQRSTQAWIASTRTRPARKGIPLTIDTGNLTSDTAEPIMPKPTIAEDPTSMRTGDNPESAPVPAPFVLQPVPNKKSKEQPEPEEHLKLGGIAKRKADLNTSPNQRVRSQMAQIEHEGFDTVDLDEFPVPSVSHAVGGRTE